MRRQSRSGRSKRWATACWSSSASRAPAALEVDAAAVVRTLVLRNQLVLGTINAGREDFEAAIADLSVFETRWPGLLRRLVTGRCPMEDHAALLHGPARGIKNVIAVG